MTVSLIGSWRSTVIGCLWILLLSIGLDVLHAELSTAPCVKNELDSVLSRQNPMQAAVMKRLFLMPRV